MTRDECQRQALIVQVQTLSVADTLFDYLPLGVSGRLLLRPLKDVDRYHSAGG